MFSIIFDDDDARASPLASSVMYLQGLSWLIKSPTHMDGCWNFGTTFADQFTNGVCIHIRDLTNFNGDAENVVGVIAFDHVHIWDAVFDKGNVIVGMVEITSYCKGFGRRGFLEESYIYCQESEQIV